MPCDLDIQSVCPWKVQPGLIRYPYQHVLAARAVLGNPHPGVRCYFTGFELSALGGRGEVS
jgi:hypothetical protein